MDKKVLVGMSGGVDSSVAALLLIEQGYQVSGATLKLYANEDIGIDDKTRTCCSLADVEDARSVACRLGIDHHVFNFSDSFRQEVICRFADAYVRGDTPNPCIDCNRYIKFSRMLERARLLGMNCIATGHYAQVEYSEHRGRWLLKKAADPAKDQTYVLYTLTQDQLAHTLFPLGGLAKAEVRRIAEGAGLVNARKPDSQDICFVKDGDYAGFLTRVMGINSPPGNFIDGQGNVLGRHNGIIRYTVGQRRGLNISLGERAFVLRKDISGNTVTLGPDAALYTDRLLASDVNWIAVDSIAGPTRATVKTRYKQAEVPATLYPLPGGCVQVCFDEKQRAVTSGQAAVFYNGDLVLGGGTIIG